MDFSADSLGPLHALARAIGLLQPDGQPDPGWLQDPASRLAGVLARDEQRAALLAFVNEALGGSARETDARGVIWLPLLELNTPPLTVFVTVDEQPADIRLGLALRVRTTAPASRSQLEIPLLRAARGAGSVSPLWLGQPGARLRVSTQVTLDAAAPVPGQPQLGSLGLELDVPSAPADAQPARFGLLLGGVQLPGATAPRDIHVGADGVDDLDDAALELVLSLLRAQAESAGAPAPLVALAGLLGLRSADAVPDFPIAELPARGLRAVADWLRAVVDDATARQDWIAHAAALVQGRVAGTAVEFDLGAATLQLTLGLETSPEGHTRLVPALSLRLGDEDRRVLAQAQLLRVDLVSGALAGLPALGLWAALGRDAAGHRALDLSAPTVARVNTLRVGFGTGANRQLVFVLAGDGVQIGSQHHETLDLSTPGALMDAVGQTVAGTLDALLAQAGVATDLVRRLVGLDAPAGVVPVTLTDLLADPGAAVAAHWRALSAQPAAVAEVLGQLREAVADATQAAGSAVPVTGEGSAARPWRVPLIGGLALEFVRAEPGPTLSLHLTLDRDTALGSAGPTLRARLAAQLLHLDLGLPQGRVLDEVQASLLLQPPAMLVPAQPEGLPEDLRDPRAVIGLGREIALVAEAAGLSLGWSPGRGLALDLALPQLALRVRGTELPLVLPRRGADLATALPADTWDGLQALIGGLGEQAPEPWRELLEGLGWSIDELRLDPDPDDDAELQLRLADLVADAPAALREWLLALVISPRLPRLWRWLAGALGTVMAGSGHPDDPYRFRLHASLPNLALAFPPQGLAPRLVAAGDELQRWRPGLPGLSSEALADALQAEAGVDAGVRALAQGRDLAGGLEALLQRWTGTDGRVAAPEALPDGLTLHLNGVSAAQLLGRLDLRNLLGRTPATLLFVDLGAAAWSDQPAERRIDLSTAGLDAPMFAVPALGAGAWFIALGTRADCRGAPGAAPGSDGTPEQAARLARALQGLPAGSTDVALVALGGAGHAARLAAQDSPAVRDLVLLGTPLGPVSLTALSTQPTADALRLLQMLMPPPDAAEPDDEDLALGRGLVAALMDLTGAADPGIDLRPPAVTPPTPRAGLTLTAVMGDVGEAQVRRALTALVAAGLAARAQARALVELPDPAGLTLGLRWQVQPGALGALALEARASVVLLEVDAATGIRVQPALRLECRLGDRLAWLSAAPGLELRALSLDLSVPLGVGEADPDTPPPAARATLTLHEGLAFGRRFEALRLGNGAGELPALPEARLLLSAAWQRIREDTANPVAVAWSALLEALALADAAGGLAVDALDALLHDPAGFLRQRLALAGPALQAALASLLGEQAVGLDLPQRRVRLQGGGDDAGGIGWHVDATLQARPPGEAGPPLQLSGQLRLGPDGFSADLPPLQLVIDLQPLHAELRWRRPAGVDSVPLWPSPDGAALAGVALRLLPGLVATPVLQALRAELQARAAPLQGALDAVLDTLGLLRAALPPDPDEPGPPEPRALRPLLALAGDPVGWLRQSVALGGSAARLQALLDGLRALLGADGTPGAALGLATGVQLAVSDSSGRPTLQLTLDPAAWTAPAGGGARLRTGLTLGLGLPGPADAADTAPAVQLAAHLGLPGAAAGRQAVHLLLAGGTRQVLYRPSSGPDIPLIPFAGLGSLASAAAQAAQLALPFLLDRLAQAAAPVGPLVGQLGDALQLREAGNFSATRLQAWAQDPVLALRGAAAALATTALDSLATLLQPALPAGLTVQRNGGELQLALGAFTLAWTPAAGRLALAAEGLAVPGLQRLSLAVRVDGEGLDALRLTLGPGAIAVQGVTLQPFVHVVTGDDPALGRQVAVGLAVDDSHRLAARWNLGTGSFALVDSTGLLASAVESVDPAQVAARLVGLMADLAAGLALAQTAVTQLLARPLGAGTVRGLLTGVLLDTADPAALMPALFAPAEWPGRLRRLLDNLATARPSFALDVSGGKLQLALARITEPGLDVIGLSLTPEPRFALTPNGEVQLWLEADARWITGSSGPAGLVLGFMPAGGSPVFAPTLAVRGLGLRVGKSAGPLIDTGISLDSVALHTYALIDAGGARAGGAQLQLAGLAVPTTGAGGTNGIAQSIMRDAGPTPPRPAFSPALVLLKPPAQTLQVSLRAGDPPGPWWIAIRRGFGPLYLEQVGFGVAPSSGPLQSISLLMDGRVSVFGLTCAVDDLQITYFTTQGDVFNPASWAVDLGGLAVSADLAGVSIAGGLLKHVEQKNGREQIEYLGMLLGRFGVYGLTLYGGYGQGVDAGSSETYTAFFAVGAVIGPIGGPPAFFLTGIGGGLGINRQLVMPPMAEFTRFPLIEALDLAARPQDPMAQLRALGERFPMQRGTFWFAAGISFNSFALIDGIAVLAVEFGDGLDINLMGLARMALPRPQVALVSIEIALLVRFSSKEGVIWVQGQLTDNSWLLYPDVKLTGGFAFVVWFAGEHRGETVLTLGGYHPDFHREGYPVVPRIGLRWSIGSSIVIKAEGYFALTSEALMAGGDFEASAKLGPGWAEVKFGAHAIVFFDPFSYRADAYARISAGVTIDTWLFGEVTFSVSRGCTIKVRGPDFRGSVSFDVGPVTLTFRFGGEDRVLRDPMLPRAFVEKYLALAADGGAQAHAVITRDGVQPSRNDQSTPDGTAERPFIVVPEFSLTFASTVPAHWIDRVSPAATDSSEHRPSRALGVAPMEKDGLQPRIALRWFKGSTHLAFPFTARARPLGAFPAGVWGPKQDLDNPKLPSGEMIEALHEIDLECRAASTVHGPEIAYHQVEIGTRKPLPFAREASQARAVRDEAAAVTALVTQPASVDAAFAQARGFLARTASPVALKSLRGERQAPPRLGTLTEGLIDTTARVVAAEVDKPPPRRHDHVVDAPIAVGLLHAGTQLLRTDTDRRTSVGPRFAKAWRRAAPTLADVEQRRSKSIAARLVRADAPAVAARGAVTGAGRVGTGLLMAQGRVPLTAAAQPPVATVARAGAAGSGLLAGFTEGLIPAPVGSPAVDGRSPQRVVRGTPGASLVPGQVVVLHLPNAGADVDTQTARPELTLQGQPARVVMVSAGGQLLKDRPADATSVDRGRAAAERRLAVPMGTARIAVLCEGAREPDAAAQGLWGWHAGLSMPWLGQGTALAPGAVVQSRGEPLAAHAERLAGGWVQGSELAHGTSSVMTRFQGRPRTVLLVLDDPTAFGDPVPARELMLALQGATRPLGPDRQPRPPVLLAAEGRSVLAYDIVPDADAARRVPEPVSVSVGSDAGWSLVGVMASEVLDARAAAALVAARGLDAALQPLAGSRAAADAQTQLQWRGAVRSLEERLQARAQARGARAAATRSPLPLEPVDRRPRRRRA